MSTAHLLPTWLQGLAAAGKACLCLLKPAAAQHSQLSRPSSPLHHLRLRHQRPHAGPHHLQVLDLRGRSTAEGGGWGHRCNVQQTLAYHDHAITMPWMECPQQQATTSPKQPYCAAFSSPAPTSRSVPSSKRRCSSSGAWMSGSTCGGGAGVLRELLRYVTATGCRQPLAVQPLIDETSCLAQLASHPAFYLPPLRGHSPAASAAPGWAPHPWP